MKALFAEAPKTTILVIFIFLTIAKLVRGVLKKRFTLLCYCDYLWIFFLFFTLAEFISLRVGVWVLAPLFFALLREYFSLVDTRIDDRWAIWAAYLSVPFVIYYVQIEWYGMFIVFIPVYTFLMTAFLVTLGGKSPKGVVLSIGVIHFGLFLFVYALGHIAYLSLYSRWMAIMLLANILVCDVSEALLRRTMQGKKLRTLLFYLVPSTITVFLNPLRSPWTGIPNKHSVILALMIAALVMIGKRTVRVVESDLGIVLEELEPGKGEMIDNIKSLFFTAPIVFHYIRYFLK